jgi:hypothetical protein
MTALPDWPARIRASGRLHADPPLPDLLIPDGDLETLLDGGLAGLDLSGAPLRSRSKILKSAACAVLGYPVPPRFPRTRPRFPGQDLELFAQGSRNLQLWNDVLVPGRRYGLALLGNPPRVLRVRLLRGSALLALAGARPLTTKLQARLSWPGPDACLASPRDPPRLAPHLARGSPDLARCDPSGPPESGLLLGAEVLFGRLRELLGTVFPDPGAQRERSRGDVLHRRVAEILGYGSFRDGGQFPDIRHQLLEVKLATSPTVDLGLADPASEVLLPCGGVPHAPADVRYALYGGRTGEGTVRLESLLLVSGRDFFGVLAPMGGGRRNAKLQVPLPPDLWN